MRRAWRNGGVSAGAAVLVALALDLWGELPAAVHPVVGFGRLVRGLERIAPKGTHAQLAYGALMLTVTLPCATLPAMALERGAGEARRALAQRGHAGLGVVVEATVTGVGLTALFALRLLAQAGGEVRMALECDDLPAAREALRNLVSRERASLSAELVAAAAVESLAENLSDSVVSPLLAYALFGLPGAAAYRLVNTADAMIGYRGRYEYLGKATARCDDALNLISSRLTAALVVLLAPLYSGDMRAGWRLWRRDAGRTASPNAGQPMAAAAGTLGMQLEKVGHYTLGDPVRPATAARIAQAERMTWWVGGVAVGLCALLAAWRGSGQ